MLVFSMSSEREKSRGGDQRASVEPKGCKERKCRKEEMGRKVKSKLKFKEENYIYKYIYIYIYIYIQ